jgi:hypothetical protein
MGSKLIAFGFLIMDNLRFATLTCSLLFLLFLCCVPNQGTLAAPKQESDMDQENWLRFEKAAPSLIGKSRDQVVTMLGTPSSRRFVLPGYLKAIGYVMNEHSDTKKKVVLLIDFCDEKVDSFGFETIEFVSSD